MELPHNTPNRFIIVCASTSQLYILTWIHLFEGVFDTSHEDIQYGTQLEIEGIKAFENPFNNMESSL